MEPFIQYNTIQAIHLDAKRQTKPSVLLHFIQEAAGGHCLQLGLDWESLATKGLFWAVIRHRLEINRLPLEGETIRVETWPMPTTKTAFPRAAAGYDAEGKLVFRCTSLWVLMDRETRKMLLPGKSGIDLEGITLGDELEAPGSLPPIKGEEAGCRRVWYSELDRNGHMNNTHYLDWALDLLPVGFRRLIDPHHASISYLSEILEGEDIYLTKAMTDDGVFLVDAHRLRTDVPGKFERVFAVRIDFDEVL